MSPMAKHQGKSVHCMEGEFYVGGVGDPSKAILKINPQWGSGKESKMEQGRL